MVRFNESIYIVMSDNPDTSICAWFEPGDVWYAPSDRAAILLPELICTDTHIMDVAPANVSLILGVHIGMSSGRILSGRGPTARVLNV